MPPMRFPLRTTFLPRRCDAQAPSILARFEIALSAWRSWYSWRVSSCLEFGAFANPASHSPFILQTPVFTTSIFLWFTHFSFIHRTKGDALPFSRFLLRLPCKETICRVMYRSRSGLAPTRSTATEMPHHDLDPLPRRDDARNPPGAANKRRNRPSAPDPEGGEKFVNIMYSCGDHECNGQIKFPYSRLRRFSKRARRELRSAGAACQPGGTIRWEVKCQHWQQDMLFDRIFDWFRTLPNTEPSEDFVSDSVGQRWVTGHQL